MILKNLFLPGSRTYTVSIIVLIIAALLQADAQEILDLAPMLKIFLNMGLAILLPLVPVFIRKALPKDYQAGSKSRDPSG